MKFPGKNFKIEKIRVVDVLVFKVSGEFDVYTAIDLKIPLQEAISEKQKKIIVDMGAVDFIDSSGLAILVNALKRQRTYNGKILLVIKRKEIIDIFCITNLDNLFKIFTTIEEALNEFCRI